jgi:hypothetical protein
MMCIMLGSIALFMASAASISAAPPADGGASSLGAKVSATAQATATIRIVSGVRFGEAYPEGDRSGSRRKAQLTDAAGNPRDAELLEFQ